MPIRIRTAVPHGVPTDNVRRACALRRAETPPRTGPSLTRQSSWPAPNRARPRQRGAGLPVIGNGDYTGGGELHSAQNTVPERDDIRLQPTRPRVHSYATSHSSCRPASSATRPPCSPVPLTCGLPGRALTGPSSVTPLPRRSQAASIISGAHQRVRPADHGTGACSPRHRGGAGLPARPAGEHRHDPHHRGLRDRLPADQHPQGAGRRRRKGAQHPDRALRPRTVPGVEDRFQPNCQTPLEPTRPFFVNPTSCPPPPRWDGRLRRQSAARESRSTVPDVVLTMSGDHNLTDGAVIKIAARPVPRTALNGIWNVIVPSADTLRLIRSGGKTTTDSGRRRRLLRLRPLGARRPRGWRQCHGTAGRPR